MSAVPFSSFGVRLGLATHNPSVVGSSVPCKRQGVLCQLFEVRGKTTAVVLCSFRTEDRVPIESGVYVQNEHRYEQDTIYAEVDRWIQWGSRLRLYSSSG